MHVSINPSESVRTSLHVGLVVAAPLWHCEAPHTRGQEDALNGKRPSSRDGEAGEGEHREHGAQAAQEAPEAQASCSRHGQGVGLELRSQSLDAGPDGGCFRTVRTSRSDAGDGNSGTNGGERPR